MSFWETFAIALVPTVGVAFSVWASTRDLALRRRLESIDKFFVVVMTAHARGAKDRDEVGIAEQVAAIHLLADFGATEGHLKNASRAALEEIRDYTSAGSPVSARVHQAADVALNRLG